MTCWPCRPCTPRDPDGLFPLSPSRVDALLTTFADQGRVWGDTLLLPQTAALALLEAAETAGLAVLGVTFYRWASREPVEVEDVTLLADDRQVDQTLVTIREAMGLWPPDATHVALFLDEV